MNLEGPTRRDLGSALRLRETASSKVPRLGDPLLQSQQCV